MIVSNETESERQKKMDEYEKFNRRVSDTYKKNLSMLGNQLLVLSSGALGLSLTFVTDLVDLQEALLLPVLILSWVLLGSGILADLFGLRFATRTKTLQENLDAAKQKLGLGGYSNSPDMEAGKVRADALTKRLDLYNGWSFWLFVFGLIAMMTFISVNIFSDRYG